MWLYLAGAAGGAGVEEEMSLQITFLGGAGTVTGSKYLHRGGRQALLRRLRAVPGLQAAAPAQLGAAAGRPQKQSTRVVLTHAHLDHSGYLPLLVKHGFRGPIYCTPGTARSVRDPAAGQRPPAGEGRRIRQPPRLLQASSGAAALYIAGRGGLAQTAGAGRFRPGQDAGGGPALPLRAGRTHPRRGDRRADLRRHESRVLRRSRPAATARP